MPATISENLQNTRGRIASACERSGRDLNSVRLIAVSKTFPAEDVLEAAQADQNCFGESRLQEALPKIVQLPNELEWHFIGRVQRNKVRKILPYFDVIHGIDSMKLAEHTDRVAGELGLRPQMFLQINIGREESKGGFDPLEFGEQVSGLINLHNIRILGLMCIPPVGPDPEAARPWFVAMRELLEAHRDRFGDEFCQLSMGMSGDYEIAIEEGATMVRVGSAIFGGRD